MTFTIWHYLVVILLILIYAAGIKFSLMQDTKRVKVGMIIAVTMVTVFLSFVSISFVEKYTKHATAFKVENKRLLNLEKIVYSGFVKNDGDYRLTKVIFEVKLLNKGHVIGNMKRGTFFEASGFFDFFSGGANMLYRPQSVTKQFVIARDLKPGQVEQFRVYFDYPPYFTNVADFTKVYAH